MCWTKVSMVPTSSVPSLTAPGWLEVPPPPITEKYQWVGFSSNKNQITPIHLLNKRSHEVHLIQTLEPPPLLASPRSGGNLAGRNSLLVRFSRNKIKMDCYGLYCGLQKNLAMHCYGLQYGLQQNAGPKVPPCDRGPTLSYPTQAPPC